MTVLRKGDLIAHISGKLKSPRKESEEAFSAVFQSITDGLERGNRIVISGFGTFEIRSVKAKKIKPIRDDGSGKLKTIPAHKRVGFAAGAKLNRSIGR